MCAQVPTSVELYDSIKLSQQQELLVGDKINTTKMMLLSDKQEDNRWTDGTLLEFDIYCCIGTDLVIALHHLHGKAGKLLIYIDNYKYTLLVSTGPSFNTAHRINMFNRICCLGPIKVSQYITIRLIICLARLSFKKVEFSSSNILK